MYTNFLLYSRSREEKLDLLYDPKKIIFLSIPNSPNIFLLKSSTKEISFLSPGIVHLDLTYEKIRWISQRPKKKSARHDRASASVATLVQRVNDFSPHPGERKRVRNEFEARVDRFVIAVDPLFAKRLFLLARLCLLSFCHHPPVPRCSLANSLSCTERTASLSLFFSSPPRF